VSFARKVGIKGNALSEHEKAIAVFAIVANQALENGEKRPADNPSRYSGHTLPTCGKSDVGGELELPLTFCLLGHRVH